MPRFRISLNTGLALFVLFASAIVYIMTATPSIALWDCGEFLASSACLGIPHPPGNPLLVPMGRAVLVLLNPFIHNAGMCVNVFAGIGSAVTVMFVYLIIVRAMIMVFGALDTRWKKIAVYCGAFAGALLCAYSNTYWFCSLEASEQANICLIPVVLTIWLVLVWAQSKDPKRDRHLLLLAYIGFLGVAMHMISAITLPVIFLYVILVDKTKRTDWRVWTIGICMSTIMFNMSWFLISCPIVTVLTLCMMLFSERQTKDKWRFCFWFSAFAFLGFSAHLYMPIRSSLNPAIDENHPVTWESFTGALDRKQYGSESMVSRSFWRRGDLGRQFGIEGHMGYGGFHLTQFFHFSELDTQKSLFRDGVAMGWLKLIVYLIPTGFMLFGWYYYTRRNRNAGILLVGATLLTTVVLVWYMNFSDGTRPERYDYLRWVQAGKPGPVPTVQREVRVRDYFWNAGFMFFAMWIGMAMSCLLYVFFTHKNRILRTTVAPLCAVLFVMSPILPLTQNYHVRDRHRNWLPFDYAYNLLMSCEKNALMFTNGDNDTFPLWAIQEAFGVRRDVRIMNLSLLNTLWYIKQLKHVEPKAAVSFSDDEIDHLYAEANPFANPTPYDLPKAGLHIVIPGREQQNALRVQDKMVLNIVDSNRWRKPVYFAVTVSEDNFMGLAPYLQMQGLVYRLWPDTVAADKRLDVERTNYLIDKVYRFRDVSTIRHPEETIHGLLSNYEACFMQVALALRQPLLDGKRQIDSLEKDLSTAALPAARRVADSSALKQKKELYGRDRDMVMRRLDECVDLIPWDWRPRMLRQDILLGANEIGLAVKRAQEALAADSTDINYLRMYAQTMQLAGKAPDAEKALRKLVALERDPWYAVENLAASFESRKLYDSAMSVLQQYQDAHPGDRRAAQAAARIMASKQGTVAESARPLLRGKG